MALIVYPADAVSGAPSYTGQNVRDVQSVFLGWATSSRPLGCFSGVRPGTPTSTVAATSTTWTVQPHAGAIDAEVAAAAGPYLYALDAVTTGAMTAADGTNPRIDLISVQISDPAESDGSSTPSAAIIYTTGVPAATPTAPATPARSLTLAQINVPKSGGGAPSVTWMAPYAVAAGGVMPIASGAYPANPFVGQYVDDATFGPLRWNGSVWLPPGDSGEVAITPLSGFTAVNTPVARRVGKRVTLFGAIKQTSGNFPGSTTNCGTLPTGFAPTRSMRFPGAGNAGGTANATEILLTSGSLTIAAAGIGASLDTAYLDGISYFVA